MVRTLIFLPFLAILVAFALSNPQPVQLRLWPFDFYTLEAPLSIAILAAAGGFFFLGALFVWFGSVAARGRAGRAERRAAALHAELKSRDAAPAAPRNAAGARLPAIAAPK
jgi:uncharacterized integral membrane protein